MGKRAFDLLVSAIALVLLAPLLAAIALAIRLDSPGPALFRQQRVGRHGVPFRIHKFRTMVVDAAERGPALTIGADARITRVGRLLRERRLDELPQLINVLKGDMSVVGPRPHTVAHNEYYRKAVKRYMVRHKVKPGLTGWAQVNGLRGETAQVEQMEDRIRHDLEYIKNWSPMLDIRIIVMTVIMVLRDKNAY